jgi:hypothetical protein
MKKYGEERIKATVINDILCDICGKSCKVNIGKGIDGEEFFNTEFSTLQAVWGYGSYHDDSKWDFDFCIDCSENVMDVINSLKEKK